MMQPTLVVMALPLLGWALSTAVAIGIHGLCTRRFGRTKEAR
ncbi:hypothetical protein [Ferrimonas balearica]|nr:hypothetical protein [Ferrimonas balearica]